jgi:hypothetical protein
MPAAATCATCSEVMSGLLAPAFSQPLSAPSLPATGNTVAVHPCRLSAGTACSAKSA